MWSWEGRTKETLTTRPDLSVPCLPSAVHSLLKSAFNTVAIEKEKIKQILSDQDQSDQSAQISSLRKSLSQVNCQNRAIVYWFAAGGVYYWGVLWLLMVECVPKLKPSLFRSSYSSFKAVGPITVFKKIIWEDESSEKDRPEPGHPHPPPPHQPARDKNL